ncbi:MAG: L,D-transpeptidase family protein [Saprospiraceae bacterium]
MQRGNKKIKFVIYSLFYFIIVFLFSTIHSCKISNKKKGITQDSSLYSNENYTPLFLDKSLVENYLQQDSSLKTIADEVFAFYQRRDYQFAWFQNDGDTKSLLNFLNLLDNYNYTFADTSINSKPIRSYLESVALDSTYFRRNLDDMDKIELLSTVTYFQYARKAYSGLEKDPKDLEWYIPRKKKNYQLLIERITCSDVELEPYEPVNEFYRALKKQLIIYRELLDRKSWPVILVDSFPLKFGDTATSLIFIKEKLSWLGDFNSFDSSPIFSDSLQSAVKKFQFRMGLIQDGVIDSFTLLELNKPLEERIKQISINMERLRWMPDSIPPDYIIVNIPDFNLYVYKSNQFVFKMPVVVGKNITETSIFSGQMTHIVFKPYWNIPASIIQNEILPRIKKNPMYLELNGMEVLSGSQIVDPNSISWKKYNTSIPNTIRQKPGLKNALGNVKFLFPNSYSIYFHDTPAKNLFAENARAFSHGCIRLSDPMKLVNYILRDDINGTEDRIQEYLSKKTETWVPIHPIPVFICYFSSWVDINGLLHFRKDIYGHDKRLNSEIYNIAPY